MESPLESLLRQPLMLLEIMKSAADEVDSYKQECLELRTRVEALAQSLHTVVRMIRQGNPRFCQRPTSRIMEEISRTLEKCCSLVRRCKKGGILRRVVTITSATEFRKANSSMDDAIANVNWLLESATDEDPGSILGMPPISSTLPNLAVVWAHLSKLQGGTPELREAAASHLASLASASDQNGQFILEEGGVPQLLKVLHDGTLEGKIMAATALGNLAVNQERVRQVAQQGAVPSFVRVLEQGPIQVQAKVAWALAEMVSRDPETRTELGKADVVKYLVALMLETMDDSFPLYPPIKAVSLKAFVNTKLPSQKNEKNPDNGGGLGTSSRTGICDDGTLGTPDGTDGPSDMGKHRKSASDSLYYRPINRDIHHKEREKQPVEVKNDLKVEVTKALWLLAADNVQNSRRITETRAMLGFAKLIEMEQGEVQRNAVMAVMELAAAAEIDEGFRKFAFKMSSPAAKAVLDQLLRVILDLSVEPSLQVFCIKTIGSLAKTFSVKDKEVIKCLVLKLCKSDGKHLPVAQEAIYALLKFVDDDNFLCKEHSEAILEVPGLPYLVQLAALDVKKSVQVPAIVLLSQLALHVGHTKGDAFQEAAALSVLKSVAASASTLKQHVQFPIEDHIFQAIYHLEFCRAGSNVHLHSFHN